jgi:hypothetical protein
MLTSEGSITKANAGVATIRDKLGHINQNHMVLA